MPFVVPAPKEVVGTSGLAPTTQWTFVSASGEQTLLTSPTQHPVMQPGAQGLDGAPVQTFDMELSTLPGGVWFGSRVMSREILLPVVMWGDDETEWRASRRRILSLFGTKGEHQIVATTPGESSRTLFVRYLAGLESPTDGEQGALRFARYAVQLRAYDPFWYGGERSVSYVQTDAATQFFPGPPWVLTPSATLGSTEIVNEGDIEVWPTWTIRGPVTSATFVGANGDTFTYTGAVAAGESVTIRTDPRVPLPQRVVDGAGTNLWSNLSGDGDPFAVFWSLPVGTSTISVSASGTNAVTRITGTWRDGFETW